MPHSRNDQFGLSQFTTPLPFLKDVELCRAQNIRQLEVCENKLSDDAAEVQDQLKHLRDSGLTVCSVQARVHSLFPDQMAPEPSSPHERVDRLRRTMDLFTDALPDQHPVYVFIGGRAPRHDVRFARDVLREQAEVLAKEAQARGASVAFEPLHPVMMNVDSFVWSWEEALNLARTVNHPALKLVCDLWHVWDQPEIVNRVGANIDRVALVHCSDWRLGGPRRLNDRMIPGRGGIPLRAWGAMLRDSGYQGPRVLEMLSDTELPDSFLHLPIEQVVAESRDELHRTGCLAPSR